MATSMLNEKNEDHTPDRLNVVDSVIDLLKTERNYIAIEALGSGTYGDVFKFFNPESQTTLAAKIVTHKMITEAESLLWPTLDHPNIVPLTEFVDLSIVKAVAYIMPIQVASLRAMMSDKEFKMKVEALDQVKMWLRQTLCGLEYLHSRDLVHLDVKEDNVLVSHSSTAMICDFTCLNNANKPIRSAKVGSPLMYKPPEAFYLEGTVEGKPCDLWAFGIMSIEILTDFFLSKNLPPIEHNWLMDVHPTLHEILKEKTFKTYFDVTFTKVEKNEEKDYRVALNFIHGFLKMDPLERATSVESKHHPFLNGGSDVVNTTDDIWNDSLYMGESEFDDDEIGFPNEDDSNEGDDFFDMALEDFDTSVNENGKIFEKQMLESMHSSVVTQMSPKSEFAKRYHSSSKTFKNNSVTDSYSGINNPKMMVDVFSLSEPKESKTAIYDQGNPTKFLSEDIFTDIKYGLEVPELDSETRQMATKVTVSSEKTLASKSTNKFSTEHGIPLSEKIRNLRMRIKELIENSGSIKEENILKAKAIADEVYFQSEDVGLGSKETQGFPEGPDNQSKGSAGDFATVSKPTSLEGATLESVVSMTSALKHDEDYEETNFESFDVSSKDSQEKSHKINLVGHNSAEASLSVDSTSTTVLQTRGRRKRFIGWIQYKCLSVFKYCCPCTTTKNSSKEV
ncbi:hypothetical protein JTE90_029204 [Oedothorax gibbosus]|uniref:Protein kinase domain-containing protein n=1 Tax=Oedothorax gibbosus TaxID=931172 RepID=A0AAV6VE80_9ARAC|nr:hypothetical protein JTE90_029204 [Oedothorax gibbosus]